MPYDGLEMLKLQDYLTLLNIWKRLRKCFNIFYFLLLYFLLIMLSLRRFSENAADDVSAGRRGS